jgi:hypothetical protein
MIRELQFSHALVVGYFFPSKTGEPKNVRQGKKAPRLSAFADR